MCGFAGLPVSLVIEIGVNEPERNRRMDV